MKENETYTIDKLIEIFTRHAKQYDKEEKEKIRKWEEEYGEKYPHEYFNLPKAFLCILEELKSK